MSDSYGNTVYVNDVPYFDWTSMDHVRIGSFMGIQLRNKKDNGRITIARLEERTPDENPDNAATTIRVRFFLPLFPEKRLEWHPKPPEHEHKRIENGCGSKNVELYESREVAWISGELPDDEMMLLFPAFVFTLDELKQNENKWAEGLHNVYFVRFWHNAIYSYETETIHRLDPLPSKTVMGFPNKHSTYRHPSNLIVPRRCLHHNAWVGLYNLQKKVIKSVMKKQGESDVVRHDLTLKVGYIPPEGIQYIHALGSFVSDLDHHPVTLCQTFLMNGRTSVSTAKFNMSYKEGVLKFETQDDLSVFCSLFGLTLLSSAGKTGKHTLSVRGENRCGKIGKKEHRISSYQNGSDGLAEKENTVKPQTSM